jgi:hypothetical protein
MFTAGKNECSREMDAPPEQSGSNAAAAGNTNDAAAGHTSSSNGGSSSEGGNSSGVQPLESLADSVAVANAKLAFAAVDKDSSGFVDKSELKTHVIAHIVSQGMTPSPSLAEEMTSQLFGMLDADADGRIALHEWVRVYAASEVQRQQGRGDQAFEGAGTSALANSCSEAGDGKDKVVASSSSSSAEPGGGDKEEQEEVIAIDLSGHLAVDTSVDVVPPAVVAAVVAEKDDVAFGDGEDLQESDDEAPSVGETDDTKSVHSVGKISSSSPAKKKKKKKKAKGKKALPKTVPEDLPVKSARSPTSRLGPATKRAGGASTKRGGTTKRGDGSGKKTVRKKPKVPSLAPKETKSPLQMKLELDLAHVDAKDAVYQAAAQRAAVQPEPPEDANDRADPAEKERWLAEQAAMTNMLAGMYESNS